jgi:hypothetical protein
MHGRDSQAAVQCCVRIRMAKPHPVSRTGIALRLDPLDAAAQARKRVGACASHALVL